MEFILFCIQSFLLQLLLFDTIFTRNELQYYNKTLVEVGSNGICIVCFKFTILQRNDDLQRK